jgi:hypothetical protein
LQVAKAETEVAVAKAHQVMTEAANALAEAEAAEGRERMHNLRYKALSETILQMRLEDGSAR